MQAFALLSKEDGPRAYKLYKRPAQRDQRQTDQYADGSHKDVENAFDDLIGPPQQLIPELNSQNTTEIPKLNSFNREQAVIPDEHDVPKPRSDMNQLSHNR
jgi:hypothetical protein